jgi:hypothetical protein
MISLTIGSQQVSSAGDQSDQSHFSPGGADTSVAVVRRGVADSMAIRAIHGARSTIARAPQSDGTHLGLSCPHRGELLA